MSLRELDLSSNDLDGSVLPVVAEVQYGLSLLNLASNPRLGDVCDEGGESSPLRRLRSKLKRASSGFLNGNELAGYSPLRPVTTLTRLLLNKTNVTRLCRDWRENMPLLKTLDLSETGVSALSVRRTERGHLAPLETAGRLLNGTVFVRSSRTSSFGGPCRWRKCG